VASNNLLKMLSLIILICFHFIFQANKENLIF
jgi:hypothetical protein